MKYEVITRGRLTYYITDTSVIVNHGSQYISYNIYNTPSRSDLATFKKKLKASKAPDNVVDLMTLARECKVIGAGASKPSWIKE